jgi:hypothetical protein
MAKKQVQTAEEYLGTEEANKDEEEEVENKNQA